MKIFHIITVSEFGGAQSVVANIAESFAADHQVYILYGGGGEAWEHVDKRISRLKISEHRKGFSAKDIFLLIRLFYYRIKYKPDIVHLHSSKIGALGRIAFNPTKIIYTVHGFDSMRKAFRKFLFVEKLLKKRAAAIVGVSNYDVQALKEEGITESLAMVYNGIKDHSSVSYLKNDEKIQGRIKNIKEEYGKIVMCISRISKQKKFGLFVDLAKEMPEYAFIWIGNKDEIEGLPGNVFCLGEVHAAHLYLKLADLFILPSNYEGLPVSIIESLSYGVPVVASDVGGISEMLNGKNGFAVTNDVHSFKKRIEYILREDIYSGMCENARKSYIDNFTLDKMINGYKAIYKKIYEGK